MSVMVYTLHIVIDRSIVIGDILKHIGTSMAVSTGGSMVLLDSCFSCLQKTYLGAWKDQKISDPSFFKTRVKKRPQF